MSSNNAASYEFLWEEVDGVWRRKGRALAFYQLPDQRRKHPVPYQDTNRLIPPEKAISAFNYLDTSEVFPPFSLSEELKFATAYKEHPSNFTQISAVLPARSRTDCRVYYYVTKWDGRFKTMSKRDKDRMKADLHWAQRDYRVQAKPPTTDSSARAPQHRRGIARRIEKLPSHDNTTGLGKYAKDPDTVPIDAYIAQLRDRVPKLNHAYIKYRPKKKGSFPVPAPKLDLLKRSFEPHFQVSDHDLVTWLRSASVLPLLKEWYDEGYSDPKILEDLHGLLKASAWPWDDAATGIADIAARYEDRWVELDIPNSQAVLSCAEYAFKLSHANKEVFFARLAPFPMDVEERFLACARVVLLAFADLNTSSSGFFGTLLNSPLAKAMDPLFRSAWEIKYPVVSSD